MNKRVMICAACTRINNVDIELGPLTETEELLNKVLHSSNFLPSIGDELYLDDRNIATNLCLI